MAEIFCYYIEIPSGSRQADLESVLRLEGYAFIAQPEPCVSESLEEVEVRIRGGQRG